jgi:hypothetical protein
VIKHLNHVVHGTIEAADDVDQHGLFFGNHHYDLEMQLQQVRDLFLSMS